MIRKLPSLRTISDQKGIDLNHDFYVVVGKQYRTENAYTSHQHNIFILIKLMFFYYLFVLS